MARKQRTITDVVADIMAGLPGTEEFISHGRPNFRVEGKIFGVYAINHHGDGRVALILMAPSGAQAMFTKSDPDAYFVPPYLGPRGWLGVNLDKHLDWDTIVEHVVDAYQEAAPDELASEVEPFSVKPPTRMFRPEEIDPFQGKRATQVIKKLDAICSALPETVRGEQYGAPVWKAGKKTFVSTHYWTERLKLSFWVGADRQNALCEDERFCLSPLTGHNGWIDLDVEGQVDWGEIEHLALESYRHFALKRMLKALED